MATAITECPRKAGCPYQKIPGPTAYPLIGSIPHLDLKAPFESMLAIQKEYGPIFQMIFAGKREISICTRELAHEVCDETRWHKLVMSGVSTLRQVVQDALFTAHHGNRQWGVTHRILRPIFGPLSIRGMFGEMRDCAEQLCLKWARHGPEERIDLAQDYTRLTLDKIALCMMDYRFNSFYRDGQHHPFVKHMVAILSEADIQSMLPDWAGVFRPRAMRKFKRDIQLMTDLCRGMVEERRARPVARHDFLNAMLKNADPETGEKLDDDEVVRNLITFLVAGHETTSGILSFATYYLLKRPEALARAQEEVDDVVGTEQITVSHIQKLPYLDAVFREALRLMPTTVAFYVTPYKPELLAGKYLVEPGEAVCCLLDPIHRDKAVYGDDADGWKPERMLQEKFEALPVDAWKPFGNGQRICLGMTFTWQESKLAMAMLLQNFDLSMHDPDYKLKIKHLLTIKPDGFYIRARLGRGRTATDLHRELRGDVSQEDVSPVAPSIGSRQIATLYRLDTGTCEALANRLSSHLSSRGFNPTVATMDSAENLPSLSVFILGTYHGKAAANAKSDWTKTFYLMPLLLDGRLAACGAERVLEMGRINNAKDDAFEMLDTWTGQLLGRLQPDAVATTPTAASVTVTKTPGQTPQPPSPPPGFSTATVTQARALVVDPATNRVEKGHLEILLPESMAYKAGWHVQIMLVNDEIMIQLALSRYGLDSTDIVTVSSSGYKLDNVPVDIPTVASQIFTGRDLRRAVGNPAVLDQPVKYAVDDATRAQLAQIKSSNLEAMPQSLLSILASIPHSSLPLPLPIFVTLLPPTPVIMIAAGTGIAPFLSFVQQRSLSPAPEPNMLLLFGCKTPADDLYRAELDALSGVVTVDRAYSRQDGKYATDLIATRKDLIRVWGEGAVVFVCGAKKLADGVREALAPVLGGDEERWDEYVSWGRYVVEVFT
ncbi:hypothetical protein RB600_010191 [Gaeumannomyces tritici]